MATSLAASDYTGISMYSIRRDLGRLLEALLLLLIIAFIMLPIFWLAMTSFKPAERAYSTDIIFSPTLKSYEIIFSKVSVLINEGTDRERGEFGRDMWPNVVNSVLVSFTTIFIAIPLATIAAYAFSRYRFLGNRALLIWILTTQFIPAIVVAIPFFTLFRSVQVFGDPLWDEMGANHRQHVDRPAVYDLDDKGIRRCPARRNRRSSLRRRRQ